jgi:hypothetical protein
LLDFPARWCPVVRAESDCAPLLVCAYEDEEK